MRALLLMMALTLVAGPAWATEKAADADASAKVAEKDKVICRRERPTGSRIVTKVCMTKGEWEAMSDASRNALDNATTSPASNDRGALKPGI